jgi:hypothetical protein
VDPVAALSSAAGATAAAWIASHQLARWATRSDAPLAWEVPVGLAGLALLVGGVASAVATPLPAPYEPFRWAFLDGLLRAAAWSCACTAAASAIAALADADDAADVLAAATRSTIAFAAADSAYQAVYARIVWGVAWTGAAEQVAVAALGAAFVAALALGALPSSADARRIVSASAVIAAGPVVLGSAAISTWWRSLVSCAGPPSGVGIPAAAVDAGTVGAATLAVAVLVHRWRSRSGLVDLA